MDLVQDTYPSREYVNCKNLDNCPRHRNAMVSVELSLIFMTALTLVGRSAQSLLGIFSRASGAFFDYMAWCLLTGTALASTSSTRPCATVDMGVY